MKKFGIVLLSLGLIAAFGMSAYAVTPEMTGQYYARGNYLSNPSMLDQNGGTARSSIGYYDQRLRTFFRLKIADGLTFTSRFDSMEAIWGQNLKGSIPTSKGSDAINQQNISWDQAWVTFKTGIGQFDVGYKSGTPYGWGTKFMNSPGTAPGVKWSNTFGNVSVLADFNRTSQGDESTNFNPQGFQSDVSNDYYDVAATYKFQGGEAGLLWTYFRQALTRTSTAGSLTTNNVLQPYVKTKVGPVDVEAEAYYMSGKTASDTGNTAIDVDVKTKGLYVNAKYNMGAAYVGGRFIYASGDDPTTADQYEGGRNSAFGYGTDTDIWGEISPTIMWGYGYHGLSVAAIPTHGAAPTANDPGTKLDNAWIYGLFGGATVAKNLDLSFKAFYMKADQDGATGTWQSKDYGKELDVKATYKIYDQLTYNVGFAYLWTGDWFKGTTASADVKNIYYVSHWIDLNF